MTYKPVVVGAECYKSLVIKRHMLYKSVVIGHILQVDVLRVSGRGVFSTIQGDNPHNKFYAIYYLVSELNPNVFCCACVCMY